MTPLGNTHSVDEDNTQFSQHSQTFTLFPSFSPSISGDSIAYANTWQRRESRDPPSVLWLLWPLGQCPSPPGHCLPCWCLQLKLVVQDHVDIRDLASLRVLRPCGSSSTPPQLSDSMGPSPICLWGSSGRGPRVAEGGVPFAVFTAVSPCPLRSPLQPAPQSDIQPLWLSLWLSQESYTSRPPAWLHLYLVWQRRIQRSGPPHRGPNRISPCYSLQIYDTPLSSLHRSLERRNWDTHLTVFPFPLFLDSPSSSQYPPRAQNTGLPAFIFFMSFYHWAQATWPGSHTLWENSLG